MAAYNYFLLLCEDEVCGCKGLFFSVPKGANLYNSQLRKFDPYISESHFKSRYVNVFELYLEFYVFIFHLNACVLIRW